MTSALASPAAGLDGADGWPGRRAAVLRAWEAEVGGPEPAAGSAPARHEVLPPLGPRPAAPPPVLLVQSSHLWWAERARARGMAACVVHAADGDDDTAALGGPALRRRAWAMSRALDALERRGDVDAGRVAVAGHSRNGKAALMAAAYDERFAACLLSSAGVLGAIPARLAADRWYGEGLELLTRVFPHWFTPSLRAWAGREGELPVDAHDLMACVAPRPLLVSVGVRDPVESTWAAQQAALAAGDVWARLGRPGGLSLAWRPGGHDLDGAAVDEHVDRLAAALGGGGPRPAARLHPEALVPWPADAWGPGRRASRHAVDLPALAPAPRPARVGAPPVAAPGTRAVRTASAAGVDVDVHLPARAGRSPLVLWLGPLCRPTGYVPAYDHGDPPHAVLARAGLAVACHHPAGTGPRLREATGLARLVEDALGALAAAAALPEVDGARPMVAGYATGALVAAHVAALVPGVRAAALAMPSTDEPLLTPGALPGYAFGDLLGRCRTLVLVPEHDPVAPPGALAAAARAAGAQVEVADAFHRLGMATRRRMARWLAVSA